MSKKSHATFLFFVWKVFLLFTLLSKTLTFFLEASFFMLFGLILKIRLGEFKQKRGHFNTSDKGLRSYYVLCTVHAGNPYLFPPGTIPN